MGDIKVFNSAGENDSENTITSSGSSVGRVKDLYMLKADLQDLENKVETNSTNFTNLTQDAPENLDTLKEISDNLDFNAFLDAFDPKPAAGLDIDIIFLAPTA
jgi:hypothetical protein